LTLPFIVVCVYHAVLHIICKLLGILFCVKLSRIWHLEYWLSSSHNYSDVPGRSIFKNQFS